MKAYRITGKLPLGSMTQKFSQDVVAKTKNDAEHKLFSTLGGRHKVNRRQILIESIDEIKPSDSNDYHVIHHFRGKMDKSLEEE